MAIRLPAAPAVCAVALVCAAPGNFSYAGSVAETPSNSEIMLGLRSFLEKRTNALFHPPLELRRCREMGEVIKWIASRHYRVISFPDEVRSRLNRAQDRFADFLEAPKNLDLKAGVRASRVTPIAKPGKTGEIRIECELPYEISLAMGEAVPSTAVWDAILNAFLSELDPHLAILSERELAQSAIDGNQIGLGIYYKRQPDGRILVVEVIRGSGFDCVAC